MKKAEDKSQKTGKYDAKKSKSKTKVKDDKSKKEKSKDSKKESKSDGKSKSKSDKNKGPDPQKFNKRLQRALAPLRFVLILCGRYPFQSVVNPDTTYTFTSSYKSFHKYYFFLVTLLNLYILAIVTTDFFLVSIQTLHFKEENITERSERKWEIEEGSRSHFYEKVLLQRHATFLAITYVALIHNVVVGVVLHVRRKYITNFFRLWTRAVISMHMDLGKGLIGYSLLVTVFFWVLILAMTALTLLSISPSTRGSPALLAVLMFRLIEPNLVQSYEGTEKEVLTFKIYTMVGAGLTLFTFMTSKAWLLFFLAHCKILRNAFATWNGRVYSAILRKEELTQTQEGRTTYKLLYKDHCFLVDLLEGTNKVFTNIIESYLAIQVFCLCFEIYFVIRTIGSGHDEAAGLQDNYYVRPYDFIPALVILVMNIWIIFMLTRSAAEVGEEAHEGLEVLRRKTMMGRKTDEELYFMLSIYSSYTAYAQLEIRCAGYFYLNKEFIIFIVGAVSSYFLIIYQFQPKLDFEAESEHQYEVISAFLTKVEKFMKCRFDSDCDLL